MAGGPRHRRTGAAGIGAAAVVLASVGGCAWTDTSATAALRTDLPRLITGAGFGSLPDWRSIGHPTDDIREYFIRDGASYRVVESDIDDATLAVWRTGPQGPPPVFNETVVATGSACVDLHREPDEVRARVVDCPVELSPVQPWVDDHSWGTDAVAVASATAAIGSAVEDVRSMLTRDPDGRPRVTDRTATDLVRAAEADRPLDDSTVVASDVRQDGRIVMLTLTATASTPEAVDTTRTATGRWCARLHVDLDDRYPNIIGDEGPCA